MNLSAPLISPATNTALATASIHEHIKSIGIDVEPLSHLDNEVAQRVTHSYDKVDEILCESDLDWKLIVFSVKESVYKCHLPLAKEFLDFDAVSIEISSFSNGQSRKFSVSSVKPNLLFPDLLHLIQGRWVSYNGEIFTSAFLIFPRISP